MVDWCDGAGGAEGGGHRHCIESDIVHERRRPGPKEVAWVQPARYIVY